jgi:hypothetical protein
VSGSLDVCLRLSPHSCVSHGQLHLSPFISLRLAGGVCLSGCLSSLVLHVSPCLPGGVWLCGCPSSPSQIIHLSLNLAPGMSSLVLKFIRLTVWPGGARLSGCLSSLVCQFICFPVWLPAVRMSVFTCLPIHVSASLAGGARPSGCHLSPSISPALLFGCLSSLVCQSGWWCPAPWMFVFTCLRINLFPCLAGGVRLFGSLSSLVRLYLSPGLAGSVWLSLCLLLFASRSGWLCPALRMSAFTCLPMSGWCVQLCGCALVSQFIGLPAFWCPARFSGACILLAPAPFQNGSSKAPGRFQQAPFQNGSSKAPGRFQQARFQEGSSKVPGLFQFFIVFRGVHLPVTRD